MRIVSEPEAEPTSALFDPRPADYYDLPKAVCEAMKAVNLNILLAATGLLHSMANSEAIHAGAPVLCMTGGIALGMSQSDAVTDVQKELALRQHYVATNIFARGAKKVPCHLQVPLRFQLFSRRAHFRTK